MLKERDLKGEVKTCQSKPGLYALPYVHCWHTQPHYWD